MGISAPRSWMKSKPPAPTSGSRVRAQKARTCGSIASIRFGVNTRLNSPRCTSWREVLEEYVPGGISMPS